MNTLTPKQTTAPIANTTTAPSFAEMLKEDAGDDMIHALIDSIEFYVGYLNLADMEIDSRDSMNIYILTKMLRAVLKDHSGIDVG